MQAQGAGGARNVKSAARGSAKSAASGRQTGSQTISPPKSTFFWQRKNTMGTQGQLICSGCRTLLVYPQGANNVRCALCSFVTAVPPHGAEMARLVCGGCRTLLMYVRGATSVQCSCCSTVNLAMEASQVAHINCGGCGMTLMYAFGAQSVKCALCQFVTTIMVGSMRMPMPIPRSPFQSQSHAGDGVQAVEAAREPSNQEVPGSLQTQTVVVENPMTFDETGKLVSNVAVGVTTDRS